VSKADLIWVALNQSQQENVMTKKVILPIFIVLAIISISSCRHSGVAPFLVGAVIGAAVTDTIIHEARHDYRHHRDYCYEYVEGEWRQDRYGRYWHEFRHPIKVEVPCR